MIREPLINSWNVALRPKPSRSALRRLPIVPAIAYAPRLDLNNFGRQLDCPRISQRFPRSSVLPESFFRTWMS
jgi:hypothetical protein